MGLMPAYRGGDAPVFALKEIVVAPENSEPRARPSPGRGAAPRRRHRRAHRDPERLADHRDPHRRRVGRRDEGPRPATGARTVAILGSGVQGRSHVDAMQTVLDDPIIRIWSRNPAHAEALALETHSLVATSVEEALDGADVVCTATAAREPIVELGWLAPGTHVNAAGASIRTASESSAPRRSPRRPSSSTGASRHSTSPATTCSRSRSRASGPITSWPSWARSSRAPIRAAAPTTS